MARIMAIDYGTKRVGIAVTDPGKIIATGLTTVNSGDAMAFIKQYLAKEAVECIVVGEAKRMNNQASESAQFIEPFVKQLAADLPNMLIERVDERFTSKMAFQSMIDSGLKKKDRQNKDTVDMVSAVLMLQNYLETKNNKS